FRIPPDSVARTQPVSCTKRIVRDNDQAPATEKVLKSQSRQIGIEISNRFSGGCVERATPVPIPNTEVKPLGADGTARATVWESRKPPGLLTKARERNLAGFYFM